ncbi:MAG: hypothetical protein ABI190_01200 [Casimicrobiaceae bacterium]
MRTLYPAPREVERTRDADDAPPSVELHQTMQVAAAAAIDLQRLVCCVQPAAIEGHRR